MEPSYTPRQKWRLVGVLVGGVLIHLSLGTIYTFGNLNPYITSYMRKQGVSSDLTSTECSWIYALGSMGQGASMSVGGILEQYLGVKLACLIGCWLMSLGVFLTYLTIQHSFVGVVITYGLMFGLGTGLAYALPLSCAMKWLPHRKGLMSGLIVAGFGGGAFIFDQVQKVYINPDDAEATLEVGGDNVYFTQDSVLDRVPSVFLVMGGCYATMQFVGCLLLSYPPSVKPENIQLVDEVAINVDTQSCRRVHEEEEKEEVKVNGIHDSTDYHTEQQIDDDGNYSPRQMVRTKEFYLIFFAFFFSGQGVNTMATLYKAYGLTFISNDAFLSWTGTFSAVLNGTGRIFWGFMADKITVKFAAMFMLCGFTCLTITFRMTELGGEPVYFIYVCLLFGCMGGSFALFPVATNKCFGQKYMSQNYGIVFLSQTLTAPVGVFATHKLQIAVGWTGVFFYSGGALFISLLLIMVFNTKDKNGKYI